MKRTRPYEVWDATTWTLLDSVGHPVSAQASAERLRRKHRKHRIEVMFREGDGSLRLANPPKPREAGEPAWKVMRRLGASPLPGMD